MYRLGVQLNESVFDKNSELCIFSSHEPSKKWANYKRRIKSSTNLKLIKRFESEQAWAEIYEVIKWFKGDALPLYSSIIIELPTFIVFVFIWIIMIFINWFKIKLYFYNGSVIFYNQLSIKWLQFNDVFVYVVYY